MLPKTLIGVAMPPAVAALPRNDQGYPIPWFVETLPGGRRDFRVASGRNATLARRRRLCWICGLALDPMGLGLTHTDVAFVVGPMCLVNRISAEPPSHSRCAEFAAKACPFMAVPSMRRRESDLPPDYTEPAGVMLRRNPGVCLVWVTRTYHTVPVNGATAGLLWTFEGDPVRALWYAEGRPATRAEVVAAIDAGLPELEASCDLDDDPDAARTALHDAHTAALRWLPGPGEGDVAAADAGTGAAGGRRGDHHGSMSGSSGGGLHCGAGGGGAEAR